MMYMLKTFVSSLSGHASYFVWCEAKRSVVTYWPNDFNWYSPPTVWSCNSTPSYAFSNNKENCTNILLQSGI